MAAVIPLLIPLVTMIPSLVASIKEIVDIVRAKDLTPEERAAKLDELSARLDARVKEIEAMELPAPRDENEVEPPPGA